MVLSELINSDFEWVPHFNSIKVKEKEDFFLNIQKAAKGVKCKLKQIKIKIDDIRLKGTT